VANFIWREGPESWKKGTGKRIRAWTVLPQLQELETEGNVLGENCAVRSGLSSYRLKKKPAFLEIADLTKKQVIKY